MLIGVATSGVTAVDELPDDYRSGGVVAEEAAVEAVDAPVGAGKEKPDDPSLRQGSRASAA